MRACKDLKNEAKPHLIEERGGAVSWQDNDGEKAERDIEKALVLKKHIVDKMSRAGYNKRAMNGYAMKGFTLMTRIRQA